MAKEIVMPRLSDTMEEGKILRWHKQVGDEIHKGEPLVEIETDKANMELEAYNSGILTQILVKEGGQVPIGEPIAFVGTESEVKKDGGQTAAAKPAGTAPAQPAPSAPETAQPQPAATQSAVQAQPAPAEAKAPEPQTAPSKQPPQAVAAVEPGERLKASPIARRLAEERGIDLASIRGTGPGGRIVRDDVEAAQPAAAQAVPVQPAAPATAPAAGQAAVLSRMQQTIARRMVESKTQAPHFYVTTEVDTTELTDLRKRLNAAGEGTSVSYNDLIVKAVALALVDMPLLNAAWQNNTIVENTQVNVGVAVAIPRGLIVPVIRDADKKAVRQIAADAKGIVERTRENKLRPEDVQGATFSVSNLGMYDVDEFNAIIDLPQSAILAIGSIKKKPVVVDDEIVIRERMRVTISCDHRVVYGAEAAQFLQVVRRRLESPYTLIA